MTTARAIAMIIAMAAAAIPYSIGMLSVVVAGSVLPVVSCTGSTASLVSAHELK